MTADVDSQSGVCWGGKVRPQGECLHSKRAELSSRSQTILETKEKGIKPKVH